jgi:hypothetical protein
MMTNVICPMSSQCVPAALSHNMSDSQQQRANAAMCVTGLPVLQIAN